MLSFVTGPGGDVVYVHADLAGVAELEMMVARLKQGLEENDCPHDHLMSEAWGGEGLSEAMLAQEREKGCTQVHHVKVYAWNDEWAAQHNLTKV